MTTPEDPTFTLVNYEVCNHCTDQVTADHRDGNAKGCALVQNSQGQYARLTFMKEELSTVNAKEAGMAINSLIGCDKFETNGLPAHPTVRKQLITANPLATTIPEDSSATETSWDFEIKRAHYPGKKINLFTVTDNGRLRFNIR